MKRTSAAVIAIVAAGIVVLFSVATPAKTGGGGCVSAADVEHLKAMTTQAIDDAYKHQIQHLYEIWMRDLRDQPQRALAGTENARKAWLGARQAAGKYAPPTCKN